LGLVFRDLTPYDNHRAVVTRRSRNGQDVVLSLAMAVQNGRECPPGAPLHGDVWGPPAGLMFDARRCLLFSVTVFQGHTP
jgi:hypothetical protein